MAALNLNTISLNWHEQIAIDEKLKQIEVKKDKLNSEIKKFESYYTQDTKFEAWELDCFITNLALDYDELTIEENSLLNECKKLDTEIQTFIDLFR